MNLCVDQDYQNEQTYACLSAICLILYAAAKLSKASLSVLTMRLKNFQGQTFKLGSHCQGSFLSICYSAATQYYLDIQDVTNQLLSSSTRPEFLSLLPVEHQMSALFMPTLAKGTTNKAGDSVKMFQPTTSKVTLVFGWVQRPSHLTVSAER